MGNGGTVVWLDKQERARLKAAEEVCSALLVMMDLGGLDIPDGEREFLGGPVKAWADLAVEAGILQAEGKVG